MQIRLEVEGKQVPYKLVLTDEKVGKTWDVRRIIILATFNLQSM